MKLREQAPKKLCPKVQVKIRLGARMERTPRTRDVFTSLNRVYSRLSTKKLKDAIEEFVSLQSSQSILNWTERKNQRRCDLIDKQIDFSLTENEAAELVDLQQQMLQYRHSLAPLPLLDEASRPDA